MMKAPPFAILDLRRNLGETGTFIITVNLFEREGVKSPHSLADALDRKRQEIIRELHGLNLTILTEGLGLESGRFVRKATCQWMDH